MSTPKLPTSREARNAAVNANRRIERAWLAHRALWVREDTPFRGPLTRLESDERELFETLLHNQLGDGIRLEQERVSFGRVRQTMQEIAIATSRA